MDELHADATLQGGKYIIERMLGQGGFGITYLGTQAGLNRRVAIKEFFMRTYCNRDADTSHVSVASQGSREEVERFRQMAEALDYTSARRIMHLDVKPGNVMLRLGGEVVLIDFGIAKHYDRGNRETSDTPVGHSTGYVSMGKKRSQGPEQPGGKPRKTLNLARQREDPANFWRPESLFTFSAHCYSRG